MGVPRFYRWLSERYPKINQIATEAQRPEFDCLYLDMNGIVHNCTHPDGGGGPLTESDMFTAIFQYLDLLVSIVKPQKLLYMALDGVAPRAKMNQQRTRRFRAADDKAKLAAAAPAKPAVDASADSKSSAEPAFDSNSISVGTVFMTRLSDAIKYFIRRKLKEDSDWQKFKIIFSGADFPGEGEHKIMRFIRAMKMTGQTGIAGVKYTPNLRHCLYGLDADLIMLALVTHEPHFALLREDVLIASRAGGDLGRKVMKRAEEFTFCHVSILRQYLSLEFDLVAGLVGKYDLERVIDDWVFLCYLVGNDFLPSIPSLDIGDGALDTLMAMYKELLSAAFTQPALVEANAKRAAVSTTATATAYSSTTPTLYLTDRGTLSIPWAQSIFQRLGKLEEAALKQKAAALEREMGSRGQRDRSAGGGGGHSSRGGGGRGGRGGRGGGGRGGYGSPNQHGGSPTACFRCGQEGHKSFECPQPQLSSSRGGRGGGGGRGGHSPQTRPQSLHSSSASPSTAPAVAAAVASVPAPLELPAAAASVTASATPHVAAAPIAAASDAGASAAAPRAKEKQSLDYKSAYYHHKFPEFFTAPTATAAAADSKSAPTSAGGVVSGGSVKQLVHAYVSSLCWVLQYYYQGCVSWNHFFPFRYAPLISDIGGDLLIDLNVKFSLGEPFRPLDQLLAVLPPASGYLLPPPYRVLMTDPKSPILDYFPTKFEINSEGFFSAWEGVVLIPYIDETRLLPAINQFVDSKQLSAAENARNVRYGTEWVFAYDASALQATVEPPLWASQSTTGYSQFSVVSAAQSRVDAFVLPTHESTSVIQRTASETVLTNEPHPAIAITGVFDPRPPAGVTVPLPGYPNLHTLPATAALTKMGISIFGRSSDKETLCLRLKHTNEMAAVFATPVPVAATASTPAATAATPVASPNAGGVPPHVLQLFASRLVGQTAWFGWPHLTESVVSYVTDGQTKWVKQKFLSKLATEKGDEFVVTSQKASAVVAKPSSPDELAAAAAASSGDSKSAAGAGGDAKLVLVAEELSYSDKNKIQYIGDVERRTNYFENGVDLTDTKIFVAVRPFVRWAQSVAADGTISRRKVFNDYVTHVPLQLLVTSNPVTDPRMSMAQLNTTAPANAVPAVGSTVFALGDPSAPQYGATGTVVSSTATTVRVSLHTAREHPPSTFAAELNRSRPLPFFTPAQVCAAVGNMHPVVFNRLCTSIVVNPGRVDIGLRLRFPKQQLQVSDYCRRVNNVPDRKAAESPPTPAPVPSPSPPAAGDVTPSPTLTPPAPSTPQATVAPSTPSHNSTTSSGGGGGGSRYYEDVFEYSQLTIDVLIAYKNRFPKLFEVLNQYPNENIYNAEELSANLLADRAASTAFVNEITHWLSAVGINGLSLAHCRSSQMTAETVKAVEAEAQRRAAVRNAADTKSPPAVTTLDLPLSAVYSATPAVAWSPTESIPVQLGDRIVTLRADDGVPCGRDGTIVGLHGYQIEIVLDQPTLTGSTLFKRCRTTSGRLVRHTSVLNLSAVQRQSIASPKL